MSDQQPTFALMVVHEVPLEPTPLALAPWSGLTEITCIKCGGEIIRTKHHVGVKTFEPCYEVYEEQRRAAGGIPVDFPEHMDRRCSTCQYAWTESVRSDV